MEGRNEFEQTLGNWEVHKDSFAPPPPPRPRSKPWERAPVTAHAPRLQGQKIWKKTVLKIQRNEHKENDDSAQVELEKEGKGARKKVRVGGKENISDAPWQVISDENLEESNEIKPPNIRDRKSVFGGSPDGLQVIPRKRTNANHLITPRKPGRRVPFDDLAKSVEISPRSSPQNLQLKDVTTAFDVVRDSPRKIPLNDIVDVPQGSPEKPVRRRKSLRRSSRGLMRVDISGEQRVIPMASPLKSEFAPELAIPRIQVVDDTRPSAKPLNTLEPAELIQPAELSIKETFSDKISQDALYLASPAENETIIGHNEQPTNDNANMPDLPEATLSPFEEEQQAIAEQIQEEQTPGIIPVVFEPVEASSNPPSSPLKGFSTPRSRKRANTPQRRTRRSTRTRRASSVPREGQTSEIMQPLQARDAMSEHTTEQSEPAPEVEGPEVQIENEIPSAKPGAQEPLPQQLDDQIQEVKPIVEDPIESSEDGTNDDPAPESELNSLVEAPKAVGSIQPASPDSREPVAEADVSSHEDRVQEVDREAETHENIVPSSEETEGAEIESHEFMSPSPEAPSEEETIIQRFQISEPEFDFCLALPMEDDALETSHFDIAPTSEASPEAEIKSDDITEEDLEVFEPVSITTAAENLLDNITTEIQDLPGTSTPDPSTTALVEAISENAPSSTYDHDDTDLLRDFLTRVKANKEAKAKSIPKRKRSFPHSPIRLPLGGTETNLSPSPPPKDEFDVSLPAPSPSKRRRRNDPPAEDDDMTEPKSIRRSGRTRLPIKAAVAVPSFIPVRRLGQEGDNTITLRRSEEKKLAALTRVNTRKNKGGALSPLEVLAKKAEEKDDPASRQRALKEKFDEKSQSQKQKKGKSVVWAEELAQYQTADGKKVEIEKEVDREKEREKEKLLMEEKKGAVRVGVRSSRISLGMAVNGTPAPKRRMKGRS